MLAVALVLGLVSVASIFGFVWYYLMLWAWILNGLLIFATVWAAAIALGSPTLDARPRRAAVAVDVPALLCAVIAVVYLTGFTVDAATRRAADAARLRARSVV